MLPSRVRRTVTSPRGRPTGVLALVLGGASLGLVVGAAAGCPSVDPYACLEDAQCILDGSAPGICDPQTDRCAYPDPTCDSGYRFPELTEGSLAGSCSSPSPETPASTGSSGGPAPDPTSTGQDDSSADGSTTDGSTTDACTLAPSPPLIIDQPPAGPIERLVIDAIGQPAIMVSGVEDVHLRDLEVHFSGAPGLRIEDAPGLVIERVVLINEGAPASGAAAIDEYGIQIARSAGAVVRDVRVTNALTGIQVEDSDDLLVQDVLVENSRGQEADVGGDGVLVQTSERVTVERFGCINDPDLGMAHAGIFIDNCVDATVSDGVVSDVTHSSGAGVRVNTRAGGQHVVVESVDVVRGAHSCFNIVGGNDVELRDTGCRNMQDPEDGEKNFGEMYFGWVNYMLTGSVRVLAGRHYAVDHLECCQPFEQFDVSLDQFTPRNPPVVVPPCGG